MFGRFDNLDGLPAGLAGGVVSIGNFDGVHMGHQAILARARRLADAAGRALVVVTFDPVPLAVLAPDRAPLAIVPIAQRVDLLREAGADAVIVLRPTADLLAQSPEDFARDVLVDRLSARTVVEGADFMFGRGRTGTLQTLADVGRGHGFGVVEVEPVTIDLPGRGELRLSSSVIRELIASGEIDAAARCLGRRYTLFGTVVGGEQRGRRLNFPTANVDAPGLVQPADGIYAAWARVNGAARAPAAVSIGNKPTFGGRERTIEANLIDASGDFYGKPIALAFVARLRDQVKFPSAEALKAQIAKDVQNVRQLLR